MSTNPTKHDQWCDEMRLAQYLVLAMQKKSRYHDPQEHNPSKEL